MGGTHLLTGQQSRNLSLFGISCCLWYLLGKEKKGGLKNASDFDLTDVIFSHNLKKKYNIPQSYNPPKRDSNMYYSGVSSFSRRGIQSWGTLYNVELDLDDVNQVTEGENATYSQWAGCLAGKPLPRRCCRPEPPLCAPPIKTQNPNHQKPLGYLIYTEKDFN